YEKAGIIKENIPVVIGESEIETKHVFEKVAAEKNAPVVFASEKKYVSEWHYDHHQLNITVVDVPKDEHKAYRLDLTGIYQRKNIVTVLEAIHCLQTKGWKISDEHIEKGL